MRSGQYQIDCAQLGAFPGGGQTAMLGLLGRFANLKLPGELDVLTSWWVIGVALFLFVIEFVADKIQFVDSAWDVIHTFIRIRGRRFMMGTRDEQVSWKRAARKRSITQS